MMKQYKLIANDANSDQGTLLGTIFARSLSEAALFLAHHFPENYYLADIVRVKESENDSDEFLAIASSEYYASTNGGVVPSPFAVALDHFLVDMQYINDFFDTVEDYRDDSITYQIWDKLTSVDGEIVKYDEEEM